MHKKYHNIWYLVSLSAEIASLHPTEWSALCSFTCHVTHKLFCSLPIPKGSFRLAANLLQPTTVSVHCSKNRNISNYLQRLSPLQQSLWPVTSANEAQRQQKRFYSFDSHCLSDCKYDDCINHGGSLEFWIFLSSSNMQLLCWNIWILLGNIGEN